MTRKSARAPPVRLLSTPREKLIGYIRSLHGRENWSKTETKLRQNWLSFVQVVIAVFT